ncbi:hypothetical protein MIND_00482600 [Mycena indigotica]|uniref:Uncharacterized protein n=1 Tax=Mycena indigotica TaxID=2126181 RepID=A0A8H6W8H1_9AGAR|nr:uncharacterized protein MIND_00482600 [Mycena indigotica]KAF7306901.1 hypothetical protein MIND_00482600 [Mycena indigotica]
MGEVFSSDISSTTEVSGGLTTTLPLPPSTSVAIPQSSESAQSSVAPKQSSTSFMPSSSPSPSVQSSKNLAVTAPDNAAPTTMTSVSPTSPKPAASSGGESGSPSPSPSKPADGSVKSSATPTSIKSSVKVASSPPPRPTAPTTKAPAESPVKSFAATSTITDTPDSTLPRPSFISVTDSNGKTSSTAPAFFTILSTSTEPNGSLVTFTHIVANPTGGLSQAIGQPAGFFHNTGAVAGVFLIVGAILTGLVVFGLFILCRKHRRRREQHRRWLVSMHRPRPLSDNDPFVNPDMRSFDRPWDGRVSSAQGHYTVAPPRRVEPPVLYYAQEEDNRPFPPEKPQMGLAITTEDAPVPSAQSSPSIYPATLPPTNEEDTLEPIPPPILSPPPRPRRSHLRDSSRGHLITPPSSISSHSPVSDAANPFTTDSESTSFQHGAVQLTEIMGRRTLLDVRPTSPASTEGQRR